LVKLFDKEIGKEIYQTSFLEGAIKWKKIEEL
jgi:hypothetical protein